VLWPAQQRVGVVLLDVGTAVHHHDPVGDLADHGEVVTDEDQGDSQGFPDLVEQGQDLRLHRDVQGRNCLVEDEDLRVYGEGARDRDSLPLATAEFMWSRGQQSLREADLVEQPADLVGGRGRLMPAQYVAKATFYGQPAVE
jgi:hypothetical protein